MHNMMGPSPALDKAGCLISTVRRIFRTTLSRRWPDGVRPPTAIPGDPSHPKPPLRPDHPAIQRPDRSRQTSWYAIRSGFKMEQVARRGKARGSPRERSGVDRLTSNWGGDRTFHKRVTSHEERSTQSASCPVDPPPATPRDQPRRPEAEANPDPIGPVRRGARRAPWPDRSAEGLLVVSATRPAGTPPLGLNRAPQCDLPLHRLP